MDEETPNDGRTTLWPCPNCGKLNDFHGAICDCCFYDKPTVHDEPPEGPEPPPEVIRLMGLPKEDLVALYLNVSKLVETKNQEIETLEGLIIKARDQITEIKNMVIEMQDDVADVFDPLEASR